MPTSVQVTVFEPPARAELCRLRLSSPVIPGGQDYFDSLEAAGEHALFRSLLEIEGVEAVGAEHDIVILARPDRSQAWPPIMEAAQRAIEAWFAAGLAPDIPEIREGDEAAEELLRQKVQRVLDEEINPGVAAHSGEVSLVGVQGSRVLVSLSGGCQGCGAAAITVKNGIATAVRRVAPEVTEIVDVTDHAAGTAPHLPSDGGASGSPFA